MDAITSARNLHEFMLRIDRVAPASAWPGLFELTLAAATLQAHLDFIAGLPPSAAGARAQMAAGVAEFRHETSRLQSCLMRQWLSRTLSPVSSSERRPEEANDAYARALDHGRSLLSLVIPCALSWYDATIGRER